MKLLAIALLALLGCAANKPVVSQADNTGDDPRCEQMREIQEWVKSQGLENAKTLSENDESCFCTETIICDNKSTCYSIDCKEF
jgi:hypothetical protein